MQLPVIVHIVAGSIAIVAGYIALFAAKGARLHRRSGMLFVYSMVTMAFLGASIAAVRAQPINVVAGLLTTYLVVTAVTTVRPPAPRWRWLDRGATLVALAVGVTGIGIGVTAVAGGVRAMNDVPVPMFFVFGTVALLSGLADMRVIRAGGIEGARRLARHLWRMSFALFIAASSFFLGQADEIPKALRIPPLLALASFLPLLVMVYWLVRVRLRRAFQGMAGVRAHEVS